MAKFVLIGVGSAVFGAKTIGDLLHFKDVLAGSTVSLVDINPEILGLMETVARKMNEQAGSPFTIEASVERRDVLAGADFVVTSPAIKREELWKIDWEIINGAGIKQTYGENGGPGSLSHTLRNVPMMLAICRDIEELAPNAWVLNFTNPEARICMMLDRYTRLKFCGLCHQIGAGYRMVAKALDVPVRDLDIKAAGLNHFTWMFDIRRASTGEDLYPAFRERIRQGALKDQPLSRKMFELAGLFPTPGDHHLAEFLAFGWEFAGLHGRDWAKWATRKADTYAWLTGVTAGTHKIEDQVKGLSGERIAQMAVAVLTNQNSYEISMDVRNEGAIPNLPPAAIVETPGVISGLGITPLRMPPLPPVVAGLARKQVQVQELAVEAAVTGDRTLALQALVLDPVVDNVATAERVLDQLLTAHREYVHPGFFG
ncbi:MAG: alpha-glucosidase/alpha-galactosidase [Kiritimatiellae bacterium]|nr:alpha-glucosidase/alpha-galactosidase [Kiritimatiellia bacterium]